MRDGDGANGDGNHRRGHFQDPAHQLTSSASGRAILQAPRVREPAVSQTKCAALSRAVNRLAQRRHIRDWVMTTMFMLGAIPPVLIMFAIVLFVLLLIGPLVLGTVLIQERQVGIVVKRFGTRSLAPGRLIALAG